MNKNRPIVPLRGNPYPGTREFGSDEKERFFGRAEEIDIVAGLVQARRASLLFAQSGAGKSSLIHAGVVPELTRREEIGRGRRRRTVRKMHVLPVAGVGGGIPSRLERPLANVFTFSALHSLHPDAEPDELAGQRLADGLGTLLATRFEDGGGATPVLLVFDQFEELFTHHVERWRERLPFFEEVRETLDRYSELHVLFSMREDFIAELTPFAPLLPGKLRDRFRIERLRPQPALEAVQRPAELAGCPFEDGVAEELVDNLRRAQAGRRRASEDGEPRLGEYVEPVHLQIVCRQLWHNLDDGRASIASRDVRELGDVDEALRGFYEQGLRSVLEHTEVREYRLREWFETTTLITPARTRGLVYRGVDETEGLPNEAVDRLVDIYLVRGTQRGSDTWYELAHDRLVEPILTANREWKARHLRPVTVAAEAWATAERDPRKLYSGSQLAEARAAAKASPGEHSQIELEFVEASAAAEKRTNRRRRRQLGAAVAVAVVLAVAAAISVYLYFRANEALEVAQDKTVALEKSEGELSEALKDAQDKAVALEKKEGELSDALDEARQTRDEAEETARRARELARAATASSLLASGRGTWGNLAALEVREPGETPTAVATLHKALATRLDEIVLAGHTWRVTKAVFSPDGRRVLTASWDKTARIWNADTGEEIYNLTGHDGSVDAAWSPDGRRVLTAFWDTAHIWNAVTGEKIHDLNANSSYFSVLAWSPDGLRVLTASGITARIWDAVTGKEIHILAGREKNFRAAAWSPDGLQVLTASVDRTARIWNADTGKEIHILKGHSGSVDAAAWSPDGLRVLTASRDGTARIWGAVTGKEIHVHRFKKYDKSVRAAAWSPDGRRILTRSTRGITVRIWNADTEEDIHFLKGHSDDVNTVAWSPDGLRVLTASADKTARIWDAATGEEIHIIRGHSGSVDAAAWSPDGLRVLTASADKTARIWNTDTGDTGEEIYILKGHSGSVNAAAWSPDGLRVLTASADKTARIWNTDTGEGILNLNGHTNHVDVATWSPDGRRVLTATLDFAARIWNADTGEEIYNLGGRDAAWSPDGRRFLVVMRSTVGIWNANTGEKIQDLKQYPGSFRAAAWSPNGLRVLTATRDYQHARIWNADTGERIHFLKGHSDDVNTLAWSPNGLRVLTASADHTARIWNAETGKEIYKLSGHDHSVVAAAWSPDGRSPPLGGSEGGQRVLTASADHTARIWKAETGEEIHILKGHDQSVVAAAWSPDGRRVLTASADHTARIWNADTGEETHILKGHDGPLVAAAWSPDGRRILTASKDHTARIWVAGGMEHLQGRIRASTQLCLPSDVRQKKLGEAPEQAERQVAACKACVPGFFARLEGVPRGAVDPYVEAWREYRSCLDERLGGDG